MNRLVIFFSLFMLVIGGILSACVVFLHYANLDFYRKHIENMATRAIGRQIEINGHIEFNVFPYPEVILKEVSIANAKWGTEPTMVSVGHGDVAFNFLSLFSDTILARRIRLKDVTVLLERNDQQVGNWVIAQNASSAGPEDKTDQDHDTIVALPMMVEMIDSSNISVIVRAPGHTDQVYHVSSLSVQPDAAGNLTLKSSGKLLDDSIDINGKISSKASIIARGAVQLGIQASFGDTRLTGQLSTSRLATLADLQGNISITVQDIQKALKKAKIETPLTGPLTADTSINIDGATYKATSEIKVEGITTTVDGSYSEKTLALSATMVPLTRAGELFHLKGAGADALKVTATVVHSAADGFEIQQLHARVGESHLSAQGRINMAGDSNVSLTLACPNLNDLWDTLPGIDLNAKASTRYSAEEIALSEMSLTFDKSDINGDVTMVTGDAQKITANLTSTLLDLRLFSNVSPSDDTGEKGPPEADTEAPSETSTESEDRYVFKETPLQLAFIHGIEADVNWAVNHLYYDTFEFKDAVIDATAHSGHVDAKFKLRSGNEGYAAAKMDLKTRGEKATLSTVVSLSDFRQSIWKPGRLPPAEMPLTSMSLELETAGSSPRELASVARGRLLITQGPGKMDNTMMEMFSGDIFAQLVGVLNPLAEDEEFSDWDCTIISADSVDGHVNINGMLAQGEKVMIVGGGSIDLKTEKLNIEFNTKPRSGVGISADMFIKPFVKLKGTLASPGIGLNEKGTLLSGGAAFATAGLSVLAKTALDRTTAESDQCDKTLEIVGDHIRYAF